MVKLDYMTKAYSMSLKWWLEFYPIQVNILFLKNVEGVCFICDLGINLYNIVSMENSIDQDYTVRNSTQSEDQYYTACYFRCNVATISLTQTILK